MGANRNAPVIIRRKKVVAASGHHGGAWKVAYADFVTAMMAFFMLMWLLNATTEKQRQGLADYFSPTISLSPTSGGGDGNFGGDSIFTEDTLSQNGLGATNRKLAPRTPGPSGYNPTEEEERFEEIESRLARGGESMADDNVMRHVVTRITDEGLIVEVFSLEGDPLFVEGSDEPTPLLEDLINLIGEVFGYATNQVAVKGFSRAYPVVLLQNPAWTNSLNWSEKARSMLSRRLAPARVERVSGHADRSLAIRPPMAIRNDRLEIVLLRSEDA
jgi:chemotaxis protein MotB